MAAVQRFDVFVGEITAVLERIDTVLHSVDGDGLRLVDAIWDSFCVELCVAMEAVDTAMTRCLNEPTLAPFVNREGVQSMLGQCKAQWLNAEHSWTVELHAQREASVKVALQALAKLPEELQEFQRCASETLHGVSFPSNSWRTFEWPSTLPDSSIAVLREFLVALKQYTLPLLFNIVNTIGRELDTDNATSYVATGYRKVTELQEMAAWYRGTCVASVEWSREQRRREQWQLLMDQRVAAAKKELERMCDEEALERSEFCRLWRPFLPRGGEFALAHMETQRLVPHIQISVE